MEPPLIKPAGNAITPLTNTSIKLLKSFMAAKNFGGVFFFLLPFLPFPFTMDKKESKGSSENLSKDLLAELRLEVCFFPFFFASPSS
jgi:hypothetical protein